MLTNPVFLWGGFLLFVAILLSLDLGLFNRKAHVVKFKEAILWTVVWVSLALCFNVGIYMWRGPDVALQFLTGYLIEQSLSVDNIFIFILVFKYFKVPNQYQHKVLFWGIVGAIIMRVTLILVGTALIQQFSWIMYIFGAFLIVTAIKMAIQSDESVDLEKNRVVRIIRRYFPVTSHYEEDRFVVQHNGRRMVTPLLIVLVVIETTDLVFALDSIPAIFAITTDPFIVFTSNIFAIMGLRSLYFVLAGFMGLFHYLKYGLSLILAFIGVKMLLEHVVTIPIAVALGVIALVLTLSIAASLLWPQRPQDGH